MIFKIINVKQQTYSEYFSKIINVSLRIVQLETSSDLLDKTLKSSHPKKN